MDRSPADAAAQSQVRQAAGARASQPEIQLIAGPAGAIEVRTETPAADHGCAVGVICHPHPLHQGSMDNKVVHTLARACARVGAPAVRFNFRGVGNSQGAHDHGRGEVDDALAVIEWARGRWPDRELWLLGFSFGAVVAARAAMRARVARLVTVAPPVRWGDIGDVAARQPMWLVVQGADDELVPAAEVLDWLNSVAPGPSLVVLPDTGHLFHGKLVELREVVEGFLAGTDVQGPSA